MTEQELQTVVAAVIQSLKTNGKTVAQLTEVQTLLNSDYFEISGGRKVSYEVLLDLLSAAIVIDTEGITADIAKVVIQSVAFNVTGSTATLSIKQAGYDAKTVSVPVATDEQAGIITAAQKVKIDTAYSTANSASTTATAAQQGVTTLNNKLGANNGIATLDSSGKLTSSQLPSNVPTLTDGKLSDNVLPTDVATLDEDGKLASSQIPDDVARLGEDGKLDSSQVPDLSEYDDTIEFSAVLESATVTSGTSTKKSTDTDAQVFYVTALKQFVLGVRTDVLYSAVVEEAAAAGNRAPSVEVAVRLTDAQLKEAIALADFPTLYNFYLDWADRELFSDSSFVPHSGKSFICTSTDVLYYWKSSVPTLQPMGKDFTEDIQDVADDLSDLADDVSDLADSVVPRLFFNGNVLTNNASSNLSLSQFVALTAGDTYAFVRKKGVVVTLSTSDGLKSYQWKGTTWSSTDDWKEFGGSAAVGNCYNVTNEASDLLPAGTGYFTLTTAIAATQTKGFAAVGMQITFASGANTWKTYQYVGADTASANFTNEENWVDMAGMSAGSEAILNVQELCGPCTSAPYYNISYAIAAIVAKSTATGIDYAKSGLVITYPVGENQWETKQFNGSVSDFGETSLWLDFGGSGSEIETSDDPESGGEDAFSTGGAYNHLAKGAEMLEASEAEADENIDNPDTENYNYFYLINENGDHIGLPFAIPKGGGGGGGTTKTFSVNFQTSPFYAAVGGTFIINASIRSATDVGGTVTPNTITNIQIVDRDTSQVLYLDNQPHASSDSSTDYSFAFNLSQFFTAATTRRLQVIATDDEGDHASRTINVVAVDVTCESVQTLNYTTASVVFTTDSVKSLPMYRFPNNQGTITAKVDMLINNTWVNIGTAQVTDSYAHNITINPTSLGLTHGGYQIRMYGTDNASSVQGNTVYSTIMVVNPESTAPIVALRYDDKEGGYIKMYETINLEVAAYNLDSATTTVSIEENGTEIASFSISRNAVQSVTKQVTGVEQGDTLAYQAVSGSAESGVVTLTVNGSVIGDITLTSGAVCTFDFANRTNTESGDHSIESGDYEIDVNGANWSSNGFNNYLGANALAVKENVTAELNLAPFGSTDIESTGLALLFQFASNNIADSDAHLMECYDENTGAGFYVTGNVIGIYRGGKTEERTYPNGEKVTVGILVEPGTKYVEREGTRYSMIKLFLNGEESAVIEYVPSTSALLQTNNIKFNGTEGDFYLYYLIAWMQNLGWMTQFYNYLVKLTDTETMVSEYNYESVWPNNTANGPLASSLYGKGMPYLVEAPFNGSDVTALDNTTSTKTNNYITLTYRDPGRPWRNFIATDVRRRNQGTTSAKRPIKNARYYLAQKNGSTYDKVNKTGGTVVSPELTRDQFIQEYGTTNLAKYDEAVALFAKNKVRVREDSIPVDLITVKVDYSDSTNANDCGACNMMNTVYRRLGSQYMTPAQRYYDGTYDIGSGQSAIHLTGLQLNHSTANHPIAMYRDLDGTGASLIFYAKGNWKEDKSEQVALGFKDTPGYNKGCLNYGDFVEFFGTSSETLSQAVTRFLSAGTEKDTSKVYLISQYCGSAYKFYRYQDGAWTDTTGSMQQVNGAWVITGDVLNPVDGFELLAYQGMCWWQGVASVSDMMAATTNTSSWVQKLVESGDVSAETFPAWTQYFECMIDNDQLQIDLAYGRKVPYWLYRLLKFCNDCDYSDPNVDLSGDWHDDLYKYVNPFALYAYDAFTDYLAAVDQQAKNMQPMFFLDEGGSVTNGAYNNEMYVRMYPNKVYDADTLLGKDNDGGATVDPEVDPNIPSDPETGYVNPYAGYGSVLWNNIYRQPTVKVNASEEVSMNTVVAAMRNVQATVDGVTLAPFSIEGCGHFFLDNICKKWQKTVSSFDGEGKYIDHTATSDALYFYALHGLRLTSIPSFVARRFRIRDGFYRTGLFFSGVFSARINAASGTGITIKAAKTGYFGVGSDNSGNLRESVYLEEGESHKFTLFDHTEGSLLYIYQSDRIAEIDFSEISLSDTANFNIFTLATKIVIGGEDHVNLNVGSYAPLTQLDLGSLPFLAELNVVNTVITSVNASQCPRLETLYASASQVNSVTIAETAPITVLDLPATIATLKLVNLPNLSYEAGALTFEGMANLRQLQIDGCPLLNGAQLLTDAVAAGATLSLLRLAGINITGPSSTLTALMNMGVTGIAADGTAYVETGQCSGMTGIWTCSDVVENTTLASIQAYFPELTVYNAQYTVVQLNETIDRTGTASTAPNEDSIINLENGTYSNDGLMGYVPSGHITRIKNSLHVYKAVYDESNSKMKCYQLDDNDIEKLADGTSFDRTDAGGEGYDVMLGLPHFWYKGINDALNKKKYLCLSSETLTPRSSASTTRRVSLASTIDNAANPAIVADLVAVYMSAFNVGDVFNAANLGQSSTTRVYQMNVEGMKQVRWPTMTSSTTGVLFLDKDDKVISKFAPSIADSLTDFLAGDYVFQNVPANAVKFIFTVPLTFGNTSTLNESEAIAVDSSAIEAIEPDWVEHNFELIGTYKAYKDALQRLRSISGVTPTRGSGTSTTSSYWQYDNNGNCVSQLPDSSRTFNMTYLDFRNLSRCRGVGYQLVDYEMHKCVDILFMAFYGVRQSQGLFGNGQGNGTQTGGSDIVITNLERDASPLREASRPRFMGLEDWWANCWEFMDFVAVNVTSYSDYYKNKCEVPAGSPTDRVWKIRMPNGSDRAIQGDPNTNSGEIVRLRWGRFCDVVPSKLHTNTSYNQYYCDQQELTNSTGRVVARSGYNNGAYYGFVYVNASNASSNSNGSNGSRLAFRGAIEFVE